MFVWEWIHFLLTNLSDFRGGFSIQRCSKSSLGYLMLGSGNWGCISEVYSMGGLDGPYLRDVQHHLKRICMWSKNLCFLKLYLHVLEKWKFHFLRKPPLWIHAFGGLLWPHRYHPQPFSLSFQHVSQSFNQSERAHSCVELRVFALTCPFDMQIPLTSGRHGCWPANYWLACTWFLYKLYSFWTWWDKYF